MDQGKVAHYQNQNVYFDVDLTAKRNVSLGTGSAKKRVEKFCLHRDLKKFSRIWTYLFTLHYLHEVIIKGASFHPDG